MALANRCRFPSLVLEVRTCIPMIMGANIGTSITNTIVSLTQVSRLAAAARCAGVGRPPSQTGDAPSPLPPAVGNGTAGRKRWGPRPRDKNSTDAVAGADPRSVIRDQQRTPLMRTAMSLSRLPSVCCRIIYYGICPERELRISHIQPRE